ncbi:MAG: hypothetical protein HY875_10580 [Chloroflexi bacterium]|nr:hypothetical protein [Chloroflexota bacterium]
MDVLFRPSPEAIAEASRYYDKLAGARHLLQRRRGGPGSPPSESRRVRFVANQPRLRVTVEHEGEHLISDDDGKPGKVVPVLDFGFGWMWHLREAEDEPGRAGELEIVTADCRIEFEVKGDRVRITSISDVDHTVDLPLEEAKAAGMRFLKTLSRYLSEEMPVLREDPDLAEWIRGGALPSRYI